MFSLGESVPKALILFCLALVLLIFAEKVEHLRRQRLIGVVHEEHPLFLYIRGVCGGSNSGESTMYRITLLSHLWLGCWF
jgi:hypothetical protein